MKKLFTLLNLLAFSMYVMAAGAPTSLSESHKLYLEGDDGQAGSTAELNLHINNRTDIVAWVCDIVLPAGIHFKSVEARDYDYFEDNYNPYLGHSVNEDGSIHLYCEPGLGSSEYAHIRAGSGVVATIYLDIDSNVTSGTYTLYVNNQEQANASEERYYYPSAEFKWFINGADPASYTLTFDTDGGSAVESITAPAGTPIERPADPNKLGYNFTGWEPEIPETMPEGDLTCTAQWAPIQYTVSVSGEGVTVSNMTPHYGESIVITVGTDPEYTFQRLYINLEDVTDRMTGNTYTIGFVEGDIRILVTSAPVSRTITTDKEYTPYCCEYDLDFTGSDLKAYIVYGYNRATNCVLLNEVTEVPRFTAVLLKGEVGTAYRISIPATPPSVLYTNLLKESIQGLRVDTYPEIYTTTELNYDYTRMNYIYDESDGTPGFIPAPQSTFIPANSAFLQLPNYSINQTSESSTGKVYIYLEDDVIVGVDGIEANKGNSSIYDLSGRRLSKPGKGINIVGGKKIAVK